MLCTTCYANLSTLAFDITSVSICGKHLKDVSYFGEHRVLWSKGYFACSVGQASQETIEAYIKNQG